MKYIRPTLNVLSPAVRAIRSDGTDNDLCSSGEKKIQGSDGVLCNGQSKTSTTQAYEVDE